MAKILLTSCGFETLTIQNAFLTLIDKSPEFAKILFIPTAATYVDAIMVLPKCMNDLLNIGIPKENITVYNMHYPISSSEISEFDAVYFTGGDPSYLLETINKFGFSPVIKEYIDNGGVYIGVSAGSLVATNNMENNLGLVNCSIAVHVNDSSSTPPGKFNESSPAWLSSKNALIINGETKEIIR